MSQPRVAFFTDCFHEVNGVALTSREFVRYAKDRGMPLFSAHAGPRERTIHEGSLTTWEFERGPVRWTVEHDLAIDFLFLRYRKRLLQALRCFQPDVIHVTSPGDAGILGALAAHELKIPLVASWHTNLHEFAARRLSRTLRLLPDATREHAANWTEQWVLKRCLWFYGLARHIFAPNPELVSLLHQHTGRPVSLMQRGIDTTLFSPLRRFRRDDAFIVGYVGRLSPEKNVRMFIELERMLRAAGRRDFRFLLVGEGSERPVLRTALRNAELPGVLRNENLARAYASMDALVFPSSTDTFGNVVLEAMASGVPPIVTSQGGPKFLVKSGTTGYIASGVEQFADTLVVLRDNPAKHGSMRLAARSSAETYSWDRVFEQVHTQYRSYTSMPPVRSTSEFLSPPAPGTDPLGVPSNLFVR